MTTDHAHGGRCGGKGAAPFVRWLGVLAAGILLATMGACTESPEPAPFKPHIVLITIDTVRADHLGCYGYFRDTSPVIDRLAEESVLFENCLAPIATTLPSHTSLFTSTYPHEHGILANVSDGGERFVPSPRLRSIADLALEAGYCTAGFVSAAPLRQDTGIASGFEVFVEPETLQFVADETNRAVLEWLSEPKEGPLFLWVHYYDPHYPYFPPPPYNKMFQSDDALEAFLAEREIAEGAEHELRGYQKSRNIHNRYDGEIRYMDTKIGELIDHLKADRVWDDTVVILVGDHGEGLGQHSELGHGAIWHEHFRVPLLIRAPGLEPSRIREMMSVVDVIPTLVGLVPGLPFGELLAQATGKDVTEDGYRAPPIFGQETGRKRPGRKDVRYSLTGRDWKYVYCPSEPGQLFDLRRDPHELNSVLDANAALAEKYKTRLLKQLNSQKEMGRLLRAGQSEGMAPMDAERLEELRQLGY